MVSLSLTQINKQLPLAIQLADDANLADFCWGSNSWLAEHLLSMLHDTTGSFVYLWGQKGSGKSHLLQAFCQTINPALPVIYLPLLQIKSWGPDSISGIEDQNFIAIDDIDAIAGDLSWEEAIFHLYNRVRDNQHAKLFITGKSAPGNLAIKLPDLQSRLSWGFVAQLQELTDEDKIQVLKTRAKKRGFELSKNVCQFLLSRCARNLHDLYLILNQLDEASLTAKRKITIPFVKEVLGI